MLCLLQLRRFKDNSELWIDSVFPYLLFVLSNTFTQRHSLSLQDLLRILQGWFHSIPNGTTARGGPRPPSEFPQQEDFTRSESQSNAQPPTWRTRLPLLVWPLPFDLSAKGDPTSSYATGGIALRVNGALKFLHHDKVEAPAGETRVIICIKPFVPESSPKFICF